MINKHPYIEIPCDDTTCFWEGWSSIGKAIEDKLASINKKKVVIAVECNQGTYAHMNLKSLKENITLNVTCQAQDIYKDENKIQQLVKKDLNKFHERITTNTIEDYFDGAKLAALRSNIDFIEEGVILIQGIGSSAIVESDILIYSDLSRWELMQRFRRGDISNIGVNNAEDSYDQHLKWGFFVDWRICDKIKRKSIGSCDFFLDTNNWKQPKMATGDIIRKGYQEVSRQPYFTAPFFDPELWENKEQKNNNEFSWVFNFNMTENNVLFKIGSKLFETPAINAIFLCPEKILGDEIYKRYGLDMPVTCNFIDTLEENSYDLHIYPGIDFLRDNHGVHHKHNDNYYIMDCGEDASMSIGLKPEVSKEYFSEKASDWTSTADQKKLSGLLNQIQLKKDDHISLPQQVLHNRGTKAMLLHVSTAPSIFEFNLLGLDGGKSENEKVQYMMNVVPNIHEDSNHYLNNIESNNYPDYQEEILGHGYNHEITLKRLTIKQGAQFKTNNAIQILNLVGGESCILEGDFDPVHIHYSECFVIPAGLERYEIKCGTSEKIAVLMIEIN